MPYFGWSPRKGDDKRLSIAVATFLIALTLGAPAIAQVPLNANGNSAGSNPSSATLGVTQSLLNGLNNLFNNLPVNATANIPTAVASFTRTVAALPGPAAFTSSSSSGQFTGQGAGAVGLSTGFNIAITSATGVSGTNVPGNAAIAFASSYAAAATVVILSKLGGIPLPDGWASTINWGAGLSTVQAGTAASVAQASPGASPGALALSTGLASTLATAVYTAAKAWVTGEALVATLPGLALTGAATTISTYINAAINAPPSPPLPMGPGPNTTFNPDGGSTTLVSYDPHTGDASYSTSKPNPDGTTTVTRTVSLGNDPDPHNPTMYVTDTRTFFRGVDGSFLDVPPGGTIDQGVLPGGTNYTRVTGPDGSSVLVTSDGTRVVTTATDGQTSTTVYKPDGTVSPQSSVVAPSADSSSAPTPAGASAPANNAANLVVSNSASDFCQTHDCGVLSGGGATGDSNQPITPNPNPAPAGSPLPAPQTAAPTTSTDDTVSGFTVPPLVPPIINSGSSWAPGSMTSPWTPATASVAPIALRPNPAAAGANSGDSWAPGSMGNQGAPATASTAPRPTPAAAGANSGTSWAPGSMANQRSQPNFKAASLPQSGQQSGISRSQTTTPQSSYRRSVGGPSTSSTRSQTTSAQARPIAQNSHGGGSGSRRFGGGGFGGGRFGGGGFGGVLFSDIRLKQDIVPLGRLDNGIGVYRFRYRGNDPTTYVGVMAQEVQTIVPTAVSRGRDGYLRVDYNMLGAEFLTWDEWVARGGMQPRTLQ